MNEIKSPFTQEQVDKLNNYQQSGKFHPYTCSKSFDECEVNKTPRDHSKDGILIATTSGWVCPCGKYRQDWAHFSSLEINLFDDDLC